MMLVCPFCNHSHEPKIEHERTADGYVMRVTQSLCDGARTHALKRWLEAYVNGVEQHQRLRAGSIEDDGERK